MIYMMENDKMVSCMDLEVINMVLVKMSMLANEIKASKMVKARKLERMAAFMKDILQMILNKAKGC